MDAMERVILKSLLAEAENELDDEIDSLTAAALTDALRHEYQTTNKLQRLREAIEVRDAMSKSRKYVGGAK